MNCARRFLFFFFFNDTATTEIYTLSLHDALPISAFWMRLLAFTLLVLIAGILLIEKHAPPKTGVGGDGPQSDRKSTRLNSSHSQISYAVFCLKKKNKGHPCCFYGGEPRSHRRHNC